VGDEKPERRHSPRLWIPAFAGMTASANSERGGLFQQPRINRVRCSTGEKNLRGDPESQ